MGDVTPPPRRPLAARLLRAWLWLLCVVTALGMAGLAWLMLGYAKRPGPGQGRDIGLPPPAELGLDGLTRTLHGAGVIRDPAAFLWLLRLLDAEESLRTTRTVVRADMSVEQLLPLLLVGHGKPLLHLTFPEGYTRFDIASRLGAFGVTPEAAFLKATTDPAVLSRWQLSASSVEGYLFPDTYQMRVPTSSRGVVGRLVGTFQTRVTRHLQDHRDAIERLREEAGLDQHGLVTLASIVEKEAQLPRERPIIAGVFLNRLRDPSFRPHRLQADPTVAYGCRVAPERAPSCADFDGRHVTAAMVRDPLNPYNTYRHEGLPPGPICNPGLDAILAVLHATEHDFFYFVANGDGSHTFSRTLEEHNRAIHGDPGER